MMFDTICRKMPSVELFYTLAYILLAVCLVSPPTEFVSAGLTVQNLLSNFLGSEQLGFVHYHIKRTTATLLFHSLLPIGYYPGLIIFGLDSSYSDYLRPWTLSWLWQLYLVFSLFAPLCVLLVAYRWSSNHWRRHPIAVLLSHQALAGSSWTAVASAINIEFRRFDKFTTGPVGRRLIVTDSWLMLTTAYFVHVAHQSDVHLSVVGSDEHELSHETSVGVQYINILVSSINPHVKSFQIRLNATEYNDLKHKLHSPIINARNIMIRQSLSDRFLEAFRQQVRENHVYRKPADEELEPCIGCMQTVSNVKLVKRCADMVEGECVACYCRPMWCLECMGKWFASRQDAARPEIWMSCRSPCPTCRSPFCMLDVCSIV